jgi:hypothetical protein
MLSRCKFCNGFFQAADPSTEFCRPSHKDEYDKLHPTGNAYVHPPKYHLTKEELTYRVQILQQGPLAIGSACRKRPKTVRNLMKRWGIHSDHRNSRRVWIPSDKTVFLVKAAPDRAPELSIILRAALAMEHLEGAVTFDILQPVGATPSAPTTESLPEPAE